MVAVLSWMITVEAGPRKRDVLRFGARVPEWCASSGPGSNKGLSPACAKPEFELSGSRSQATTDTLRQAGKCQRLPGRGLPVLVAERLAKMQPRLRCVTCVEKLLANPGIHLREPEAYHPV